MIGSVFDSLLGQYRNFDKSILSFPSLGDFPAIGDTSFFYIDTSTNIVYMWDDTNDEYVTVSSAGGGGIAKGPFATQTALITAIPVGEAGRYAVVLATQTYRYWDLGLNSWVDTTLSINNPQTVTNPDGSNINSPSTNYLVAGIDGDYIGYFEPGADLWYIRKINTDGITYANISNNPTYTTYATAWADKASLTYDLSITF